MRSTAKKIEATKEKAVVTGNRLRARAAKAREKARANAADYEPAIVSFIDILGFRAMLNDRSSGEIHKIILSLREFSTPDLEVTRRMKEVRVTSRAFAESVSDAVVRVRVFNTQYSDGAFFIELLDLLHIQIQCINSRVLIRAGLAIGNVHVGLNGEGPVFGPAMVRAYEIESGEAIYPRIVIDDAAYEQFLSEYRLHNEDHDPEDEAEYVEGLLRVGEDGTRFIDYLRASESEFDEFESYLAFLKRHASLIRENLASGHRPTVRRKLVWLPRYHNSVIDQIRGEFESGDRSQEAFSATFSNEAFKELDSILVQVS